MIDATQEDGELMADRIRARLAAPIEVAGATLQLRVSVGVALAEAGGIDAEEALRNADFAMQWAKGLGKARAEVYNANLHAKALDRLELRSDLQRGLRGEELVLHYQPTMCLQEGTVAGFEALVRWQHPTRGLLMPAEFIPLAEETGLIVPLGSWVLREACRFAVTLPHRGQDLSMSVNVATQQLYQDGFVDEVRDVLRETGLRPNRLVLEITETALLSELDQVKPRLAALRRIGVRLAIDDFGTGYSSLAYLAELALDVLKVDKSFIDRARGGRARPVDHAGDPHHEPRAPPRDGRRGRGGPRTGGLADPGALHDGAGLPVEQAGRRRGRAPAARVPTGSTSRGVRTTQVRACRTCPSTRRSPPPDPDSPGLVPRAAKSGAPTARSCGRARKYRLPGRGCCATVENGAHAPSPSGGAMTSNPAQKPSSTSRRAFLAGSGAALAVGATGTGLLTDAAAAAGGGGVASETWPSGPGRLIRPQRASGELRRIIAAFDPDRVEANIRKLVSFGTRHTLSVQDDPNRGIGAARDWIAAEMTTYAAASGGRMTVTVPSYIQQPGPDDPRIDVPTKISNVVATLKGSVDPNRTYVITGHYDSRVTDVMNRTADAPGANDDASGTAVSWSWLA